MASNAAPAFSAGTRLPDRRIRLAGFSAVGVLVAGLALWMLYHVVNPYPFLGDWAYTSGDLARDGAMFRFNRNGSGVIYTVHSEFAGIGQTVAGPAVPTAFEWKSEQDKLHILIRSGDSGPYPENQLTDRIQWSVSDDGTILTLTNLSAYAQPGYSGQLVKRSTIHTEPPWMKAIP